MIPRICLFIATLGGRTSLLRLLVWWKLTIRRSLLLLLWPETTSSLWGWTTGTSPLTLKWRLPLSWILRIPGILWLPLMRVRRIGSRLRRIVAGRDRPTRLLLLLLLRRLSLLGRIALGRWIPALLWIAVRLLLRLLLRIAILLLPLIWRSVLTRQRVLRLLVRLRLKNGP